MGEVLSKTLSQELLKRDVARLALVATDGTPRAIPIGIFWNGSEVVMCTTKNARKLKALRRNPAVALTIDTEVHPPGAHRGPTDLGEADRLRDHPPRRRPRTG